MKRRAFLYGASALTLGQLVAGCNSRQQASLKVRLLQDSIPAQLVGEFRKAMEQAFVVNFDPEEQLQDLFIRLQAWKQQAEKKDNKSQWSIPFVGQKKTSVADLVTLGDYWLKSAIEQKLIQPLKVEGLQGWQQLPPAWKEIVKRDRFGQLSNSGEVWGAPYRWGSTVIAYRRDQFRKLGWIPKDWSDLWHPELRDRISLVDQPREVIGLTLKKLGYSYNTTNLSRVPNLKEELLALHQQVKFYSSDYYLQPLTLKDTWVAVGWSTDVIPVRSALAASPLGRVTPNGERSSASLASERQIDAVVPLSGTALWTDLWVQPASVVTGSNTTGTKETLSPIQQWIDFCWQPKPAKEISLFSQAASPIVTTLNSANIPQDIRDNPVLLPDKAVLDKSEFLKPLPKAVEEEYQALWREIRSVKH